MGQYKNEWGEISQIIDEHVNLMMGRYLETGCVFKCISAHIGFFPYAQCLGKVLMDKDWNRLNNLIYQENCFRSLCSLMCGDTHYWAFLEMLEALAVGNMKTLDLLVPQKTEPVNHIFPVYRPATDLLIGLWRKDNSVLDYAVPRAKKFVCGKRPQWERATIAYLLAMYDKNPKEAGVQLGLLCKGVMRADFDVDTDEAIEDNDAGAYESILDEAVAILPERSLRWHYRSRHEHLIAFSNIKIYNSQLITFPSSTEKAPDCGVEYVYVKDGIYDRGGKKNNVIEARRVADLVFEHFKKHPKRSLGIVTFSESQQNAVDAAIRQKRLQNPSFDKFFIEDKEEPFFIKNLENVQGDERDTIIFSIGYAKDSKGIMYMNFGPLSREGGYRRLNVAITRAKYNIKLVGSIVPTDFDLDKVSSEGVTMLRSCI